MRPPSRREERAKERCNRRGYLIFFDNKVKYKNTSISVENARIAPLLPEYITIRRDKVMPIKDTNENNLFL